MTPKQAYAFADGLLTRISRSYTIHYRDDEGLHAFTLNPGVTLADVSIVGAWPEDDDAQDAACHAFLEAVASDLHDGFLAITPDAFAPTAESVGLSEEELTFASEVEFQPNAIHRFPEELVQRWAREDEETSEAEELAESRRQIVAEFRQLSIRFPVLERNGFGGMIRELSNMLNGDADEFDAQRADGLLASLSSFASSGY